jgi:hypothetical protein
MKLILKLAVAGLLCNAVYRIGSEYLTYIEFRDGIRDAAMYRAHSDAELSRLIMDLATDYDLPVAESTISMNRQDQRVLVEGSYSKPIEILPTVFYPWHFSWSIDAKVSIVVPPFTQRPKTR